MVIKEEVGGGMGSAGDGDGMQVLGIKQVMRIKACTCQEEHQVVCIIFESLSCTPESHIKQLSGIKIKT